MIYITADTHIPHDCHKLNSKNFPEQEEMTKKDYVVVAGDFGLIWKNDEVFKIWEEWFNNRNFTTLFVDGNHENFNWLEQFPIVDKFGGKVGKISESIYHLRRGEIYEIEGKKIFTFGGAESIDMLNRTSDVSWWKQEMPNYAEMNYGIDNLEKANFDVDIIVTHSCPLSIKYQLIHDRRISSLENYLENIKWLLKENNNTKYRWYFGHYHQDKEIDNFRVLFDDVVPINSFL